MNSRIWRCVLGIICLTGVACSPSPEILKPITQQNQQNIELLVNNIRVLLALCEPLLDTSNKSIIYQHIGKREQEMIAVVGAATLPPPTLEWEELFTQAALTPLAQREKYLERYQFVKSAIARGVEDSELEKIKRSEGWIYQAVADEKFTPQQAHELLKTLITLRKNNTNDNEKYFIAAEEVLKPSDPLLAFRRETIESVHRLFKGLEQELNQQLTYATLHSQAMTHFSESGVNVGKSLDATITGIDKQQLEATLDTLSKKYLGHSSFQGAAKEAAIELLTRKFGNFMNKL